VTEIVDAQVHSWEPAGDDFPWRLNFGTPEADAHVAAHFSASAMPPEQLLACMDTAGVDAAVMVSPSIYGPDTAYARHTVARDPARLAFVGLVDATSPTLERDVAQWRSQPGALAIRISVYFDWAMASLEEGPLRDVLAAAERHAVPVCVYPAGYVDRMETVVRAFPDLQFVIDHLGLKQPPVFMTVEGEPFAQLEGLLRLAAYPNVAVKATGVPSLSRESYPFTDVWGPLRRVLDAFGCERVMWGTDFTRVAELMTYRESVDYLREVDGLSVSDRALLYGGTLRRVFRWPA
jgi:L-fuconolactonase